MASSRRSLLKSNGKRPSFSARQIMSSSLQREGTRQKIILAAAVISMETRLSFLSLCAIILCFMKGTTITTASVLVTTNYGTMLREVLSDNQAGFGPNILADGEIGDLCVAKPLDSCSPLRNRDLDRKMSPIALVIRGGCTYDDKVRNAQAVGFKVAIVFDDEYRFTLREMNGSSEGINIPSIFVSKTSGQILMNYVDIPGTRIAIVPDSSTTKLMLFGLLLFFGISCTIYIRTFQEDENVPPSGINRSLVSEMPIESFDLDLEDNSTSGSCAVCCADYELGDKLRRLPCSHKFHANCVDEWLTKWRSFCPVCKHDARNKLKQPPSSESTPLMSQARTTTSYSSI